MSYLEFPGHTDDVTARWIVTVAVCEDETHVFGKLRSTTIFSRLDLPLHDRQISITLTFGSSTFVDICTAMLLKTRQYTEAMFPTKEQNQQQPLGKSDIVQYLDCAKIHRFPDNFVVVLQTQQISINRLIERPGVALQTHTCTD